MLHREPLIRSYAKRSFFVTVVGLALPLLLAHSTMAQEKKTAPKVSAPASHPATKAAGTGAKTGSTGAGAKTGAGGRPGSSGTSGAHTSTPGTTRTANGGTRTVTKSGAEVTKNSTGKVTQFKAANGHEAKFNSQGHVREVHGEVHGNRVTVAHGPGGMRRTVVERPDHSRLVAEGHGRGYIQRPYMYGGHAYYSRAYYYHGGYYNSYYRGYYYNGVYLNGYMPSYYYPAAYYGWAYNPWPAPVPYAWGWAGNPWYGYYGAYFRPYPVYPSAAFWIADYMVAASLADAYAAAAVANAGRVEPLQKPHLVFASYDPDTDTASPTMTKEVKDALSQEINAELDAQKAAGQSEDKTPASLETLLADGKPHVFVASAALSVPSAGVDCGLTEGDVLALNAAPPKDASAADLRVLASKQADCTKGSVVTVEVTDLQEMQNHLLSNIDKGMQEMKDHPGQGGLPAPPADAVSGTKAASYASAAPAADPNGGAELDAQAQEGTQLEQQVVAEANASDGGETATTAGTPSPIGGTQPAAAPAPARPAGPVTITLGQTPAQVIASKGQPTNKVNFPNKIVYIYPDMKIIFVGGKVSDVQ